MNICIFTRTTLAHNTGGMEVHADLIAKGLADHGYQVTVLTTRHPGDIEEEVKDGVKIFYLKDSRSGKYSGAWHKQAAKKLLELNEIKKIDLVFSESGGAFYLLRKKINRKLNLPVVVVMHGIFFNELKTRFNLGLSLRNILAIGYYVLVYLFTDLICIPRAEAIIATSNEQNHLIRKFYFLPENKVFTVFNGIDIRVGPADSNLKKNLGFAAGDKIILSVARLKREKGLHVILQSLPEILVDIPNVKLLIVGDGEYREYLENLATELGLLGKVIFAGAVPYEELGKYFHLADVFVNSTIRENGYDLTIIQGMAYGKPVVVSRLKSLTGVIADGKNGFLVGRGEVKELSLTVRKLLQDPKMMDLIGKAAQAQAQALYSVGSMVDNTIKVFEKCLSK